MTKDAAPVAKMLRRTEQSTRPLRSAVAVLSAMVVIVRRLTDRPRSAFSRWWFFNVSLRFYRRSWSEEDDFEDDTKTDE